MNITQASVLFEDYCKNGQFHNMEKIIVQAQEFEFFFQLVTQCVHEKVLDKDIDGVKFFINHPVLKKHFNHELLCSELMHIFDPCIFKLLHSHAMTDKSKKAIFLNLCEKGQISFIQFLLNEFPDINEQAYLDSGLNQALKHSHIELAQFLLDRPEKSANITAAHLITQGYINESIKRSFLKKLLTHYVWDTHYANDDLFSTFCCYDDLEMVQFLTQPGFSYSVEPQFEHFIQAYKQNSKKVSNYFLYDLNMDVPLRWEKDRHNYNMDSKQINLVKQEIEKRDFFLKLHHLDSKDNHQTCIKL